MDEGSGDDDLDEVSGDDSGSGDGSDIEILTVVDKGKTKKVTSATRKIFPVPKASRGVQKKVEIQAIDEEASSGDESGESVC